MNYGPAQVSVRTDHQKRSIREHNDDGMGTSTENHSRLFKALVHEKCVLLIYWYQRFVDSKKKTTTRTTIKKAMIIAVMNAI